MSLSTKLIQITAFSLTSVNCVFNWLSCPDLAPLESSDSDGIFSTDQPLDFQKLSEGKWFEIMKDAQFEPNTMCSSIEFKRTNNNGED